MALLSPQLTAGRIGGRRARSAGTCPRIRARSSCSCAAWSRGAHADADRQGARSVPAGGRRGSAICAGVGGARPRASRVGQVLQRSRAATIVSPNRRSSARWSCRPTCRSRIATSRTSNRKHGRASDAIVAVAEARAHQSPRSRSCSRGWCTPAATPDLLDASIAAHEEAMRLDPNVATGVEYTLAHLALTADRRRI